MDEETVTHRGAVSWPRGSHRRQDAIPKVFQFIHGILTEYLSCITCCARHQEHKTGKGNRVQSFLREINTFNKP